MHSMCCTKIVLYPCKSNKKQSNTEILEIPFILPGKGLEQLEVILSPKHNTVLPETLKHYWENLSNTEINKKAFYGSGYNIKMKCSLNWTLYSA